MELEKLKDFINFMNENSLCELEIEEEGKRIRLKKFSENQPVIVSQMPSQAPVKEEKPGKKEGTIEIKSPMVGTFYRAPSPGAKPYIEIGDVIKPGDVVCIVEAMKLMNEIKAEIGGKITEVLVENGQPVEFGQTLFVLEAI
ncbi:MAG: acetyl-CoA carboxylase biotin carboxyl carrier protein [Candidatus Omnitrophica bacterium]|nr:acetyl-CoA carboxylase biotin carboxyl carrier protein [Candidatus Omnitrophota bacterium]